MRTLCVVAFGRDRGRRELVARAALPARGADRCLRLGRDEEHLIAPGALGVVAGGGDSGGIEVVALSAVRASDLHGLDLAWIRHQVTVVVLARKRRVLSAASIGVPPA